jgi:hypothetical protein
MSQESPSELFNRTFQSIITTKPNTIEPRQIEILVELITNENSGLHALTGEYIDGDVQTTFNPKKIFYQSCTSPEFISDIWRHIRSALIEKLDIYIKNVTFPDNYETLNAVEKCQHVGNILEQLDTIYHNLYPGVVSFFSHTLQGLSGDLRDKVNSNIKTKSIQHKDIESFAKGSQTSISFITGDMQNFSRRFLSNSKILPQMCYYGRKCKFMKDVHHRNWFVHPFGNTQFFFESLVPINSPSTVRSAPYGGSNTYRRKMNLKKTKHIYTRRRPHLSTKRRTRRRRRY